LKVLLIRPDPGNERFGLGPFFRVEPLGLEYVGEAARRAGHEVTLIDERFDGGAASWARRVRPAVVGIAAMHALEYDQVLRVAGLVRRAIPEAFIVVGGHAAAAFPAPLETLDLDALCVADGEQVFPALLTTIEHHRPVVEVAGLRVRTPEGWVTTPPVEERASLDCIPLPGRDLVRRYRRKFHCLHLRPVWLLETARGCPYRCSFCSVWQLYDRSFRERSIDAVVADFADVGENVFVVDDLFWNHPARSLELARALIKKGIRKHWILVQSRTDLVARHADLLEAWRPLAKYFDIFFGFEGASDTALEGVVKDTTATQSLDAAEVARSLDYGVTGNFLVDPAWEEHDFEQLWDFVARHGFHRAGFTILTPLPGTEFYQGLAPVLEGQPWYKYDMSHLMWEPRLGVKRFFELYAETWQRSILNTSGQKKLSQWFKHVRLLDIPHIVRILRRTQRLMDANAYLTEHAAADPGNP
jgi:hopanoid C-3 methylase